MQGVQVVQASQAVHSVSAQRSMSMLIERAQLPQMHIRHACSARAPGSGSCLAELEASGCFAFCSAACGPGEAALASSLGGVISTAGRAAAA